MTRGDSSPGLLAVDIGNSRAKFGWFSFAAGRCETPGSNQSTEERSEAKDRLPQIASGLPMPDEAWCIEDIAETDPFRTDVLGQWLNTLPLAEARCMIASVRRAATERLRVFFQAQGYGDLFSEQRVLRHDELPLEIHVEHPECVGIDRLLVAVAANRLRHPDRAAIAVDAGSAITVDLIAQGGSFEGGAIFPGPRISAQALQAEADALPRVIFGAPGEVPALPGRSTHSAIAAGLHWAMVGSVREIIAGLEAPMERQPDLLLTGGNGLRLAQDLSATGRNILYRPNLVLDGIACLGAS